MMTIDRARQSGGHFSGSYDPDDVTFLLKIIDMPFTDVGQKERLIQSGRAHYSEMLSREELPGADYLALYERAMRHNGPRLARHINRLAARIAALHRPDAHLAIVSLLRAGTPIGVLVRRALVRGGVRATHYSISIIRGRGIDRTALRHICRNHRPDDILFLDGWTGKGAIATELRGAAGAIAEGVEPRLFVVADPAGVANAAATTEDYLIPSGILNGVVSGLVSRSVLNDRIGVDEFHGCVILDHLAQQDISRNFVDRINRLAAQVDVTTVEPKEAHEGSSPAQLQAECRAMLDFIAADAGIAQLERIKPGIAESARALLRRMPKALYLRNADDPDVAHLVLLAGQKSVPVRPLPPIARYRAVAVIATTGEAE